MSLKLLRQRSPTTATTTTRAAATLFVAYNNNNNNRHPVITISRWRRPRVFRPTTRRRTAMTCHKAKVVRSNRRTEGRQPAACTITTITTVTIKNNNNNASSSLKGPRRRVRTSPKSPSGTTNTSFRVPTFDASRSSSGKRCFFTRAITRCTAGQSHVYDVAFFFFFFVSLRSTCTVCNSPFVLFYILYILSFRVTVLILNCNINQIITRILY